MDDSQNSCDESPNDPKLSDGGAWRGACPTVERTETMPSRLTLRAKIARAVTRVAVRCGAWLGVFAGNLEKV